MKNNITISQMTSGDVDAVYRIEKESFGSPWSKRSLCEELSNSLAYYVVMKVDDTPVGYAGMWTMLDESHITKIAITNDMRGMGLSKMLMKHMMSMSLQKKASKMTLEVRETNAVAQALYKSMGFHVEGVRKRYYPDTKEDGLIMWMDLY